MTGQSLKELASELTLRAVKWEDLEPVVQLIYDVCDAEGDTSVAVTVDDLKNEWEYEGFDPQQDAFVVAVRAGFPRAGQVVGYVSLDNMKDHYDLRGDLYIHPEFKGMGIGEALLVAMETRAQDHVPLAPSDQRVFIRAALDQKDETGKAIFLYQGYSPIRYYWRMEIVLEEASSVPQLPAGLAFRPFEKDAHAQAVWQARNEAFADHWGSHALTYEEFATHNFDNPEYDPELWSVIWDGEDVAAFSINHYKMGIGWVHTLGVRRAWRKKGLGLALLQHAFGLFYQRGMMTIGLTVDASNPTGATELYRKAGMHVVSEFVAMEKDLRTGE
jgi:mycothiol synthase